MNTPLFHQAPKADTIDEAIRRGFPIFFDEAQKRFVVNSTPLAKPSHLKTRKDAETFASLNGFKLEQ